MSLAWCVPVFCILGLNGLGDESDFGNGFSRSVLVSGAGAGLCGVGDSAALTALQGLAGRAGRAAHDRVATQSADLQRPAQHHLACGGGQHAD